MSDTSGNGNKRHLFTIIRILVAVGALYLAFGKQDMGELGEQLLGLNPWYFAAAVGLFLFAQVLFVTRWWLLLRVLSIDISLGVGMKLHLLGWFYNNCLPSSVGGDLLRAWYITKHVETHKRTEAVLSVFFDRVIGLTGMIVMAAVCYWLIGFEGGFGQEQAGAGEKTGMLSKISEYGLILGIGGAVVILAICVILGSKKGRGLLGKVWMKLWHIAGEGIAAIKLYGKSPVTIFCTIGLTIILQGISIIGFCLLGSDLGIDIPIKYYFVFFPVSWLIGTIPISIGGLGVMEGSLALMFEATGVSGAKASAIAICQRLVWWAVSLLGVFIHLFGGHLPKEKREFFVDGSEDLD